MEWSVSLPPVSSGEDVYPPRQRLTGRLEVIQASIQCTPCSPRPKLDSRRWKRSGEEEEEEEEERRKKNVDEKRKKKVDEKRMTEGRRWKKEGLSRKKVEERSLREVKEEGVRVIRKEMWIIEGQRKKCVFIVFPSMMTKRSQCDSSV
ncbi:hypothetical protein Pcinc_036118 [Petrolisthes cinctipes]|uniref:Uncharacterized protein n=1 Tax=Petrolisthes cinctipes TaxID=88211 RepID=A0AAE1BVK2_PETCI|nr:hypothetical protein Pcinc_036118 [Petrolisthes cinctipes]